MIQEITILVVNEPYVSVQVCAKTVINGQKYDINFNIGNDESDEAISAAFASIWPAFQTKMKALSPDSIGGSQS